MRWTPDLSQLAALGDGFIDDCRSRTLRLASELAAEGERTVGQLSAAVAELIDRNRRHRHDVTHTVLDHVQRGVEAVGIATKNDLAVHQRSVCDQISTVAEKIALQNRHHHEEVGHALDGAAHEELGALDVVIQAISQLATQTNRQHDDARQAFDTSAKRELGAFGLMTELLGELATQSRQLITKDDLIGLERRLALSDPDAAKHPESPWDRGPIPRAARSPQQEVAAIAAPIAVLVEEQRTAPPDPTVTPTSPPAAPAVNSRGQGPQLTTHDHGPAPRAARSPQEEAAAISAPIAALIESHSTASTDSTSPPQPLRPARAASPLPRSANFDTGVVGPQHSGRPLGKLLVDRGFLVDAQLQGALAWQATTGGPLGQILVDQGLITDRDLVELLAEQLRLPVVELARIECDPAVSALLPNQLALQLAALPFRRVGETVDVAIADPTDDEHLAALIETLNAPLRLFLATRADIEAAIERLHHQNRP